MLLPDNLFVCVGGGYLLLNRRGKLLPADSCNNYLNGIKLSLLKKKPQHNIELATVWK
jgi:hypothetical protein